MSRPNPPKAELIAIGRELLDGRVLDRNSSELGQELHRIGYKISFVQRVDDRIEDIVSALKLAGQRSQLVLCTGGLGPTQDDLSVEALAKALEQELIEESNALSELRHKLSSRGRLTADQDLPTSQRKQALRPQQAQCLSNSRGTAPGVWAQTPTSLYVMLPGVPSEMRAIFADEIKPRLLSKDFQKQSGYTLRPLLKSEWLTVLERESVLAELLSTVYIEIQKLGAEWELCYQLRQGQCVISLLTPSDAQKDFERLEAMITQTLSARSIHHTTQSNTHMPALASLVLDRARKNNVQLTCVESCTGGLVAQQLTSIAGCSSNFWGSWVCYDNHAKINLGVPTEVIAQHGAVSQQCAEAMALAGLKNYSSNPEHRTHSVLCVSTTGIAGPSPLTEGSEKPVGLCYIAVARLEFGHTPQIVHSTSVQFSSNGDRNSTQELFATAALKALWDSML